MKIILFGDEKIDSDSEKFLRYSKNLMKARLAFGSEGYYLKLVNINSQKYKRIVSLVEEKDPVFYAEYLQILEEVNKKFATRLENILLLMSDYITFGVPLNENEIRTFDIIDAYYFKNNFFANKSRREIMPMIDEIMKKYYCDINYKLSEVRKFLSMAYENKENKFAINDTCYELSEEEKEQILAFFRMNKITVNELTLGTAVKRLKNQEEDKNNDYFKIKMRIKEENE